jgi:hypothetical protein
MKVKFMTSIYCNLFGTEFGGRMARGSHYRYSLLSILKMTDADFVCYTSQDELSSLETFFYEENNVSKDQLKFVVFDISETKFKDLINQHKNVDDTKRSDRCVEIQYSKFHWWWNEDKTYDYYFWIDAGLSHCGIIPDKYLVGTHPVQRYYESTIFDNRFLKNLVEFTGDKFFLFSKENDRNYWAGTVDPKWYTEHNRSRHIIGGLFGGKKELWDEIVPMFEDYTKKIIEEDNRIFFEENIMTLMYFNHIDKFITKEFDIWWHEDNHKEGTVEFFQENKSFYKMLEEIYG